MLPFEQLRTELVSEYGVLCSSLSGSPNFSLMQEDLKTLSQAIPNQNWQLNRKSITRSSEGKVFHRESVQQTNWKSVLLKRSALVADIYARLKHPNQTAANIDN